MGLASLASYVWEVPSYGNLSLIEAIWLLTGLFTIAFSSVHIVPLWRDWRLAKAVTRVHSDKLYLDVVSFSYVRREAVRIFQGMCIAGLGFYTWYLPPPPPGATIVTPVGLIVTGVLMMIAFTAALQSWWDSRTRNQILHILDKTSEEIIRERANDGDQRIQEKRRQAS